MKNFTFMTSNLLSFSRPLKLTAFQVRNPYFDPCCLGIRQGKRAWPQPPAASPQDGRDGRGEQRRCLPPATDGHARLPVTAATHRYTRRPPTSLRGLPGRGSRRRRQAGPGPTAAAPPALTAPPRDAQAAGRGGTRRPNATGRGDEA